ncbi:hypothetical protein BN14_03723 [Rhizoctonia solani AG-1 IB]|uniref:Uncharacterized protein n=1 Tax=Thanatephorus cucumeris (strain AG1-IB / isolate 7/3/14) TaxID=1108050 RepID=M5BTA3_THACB|nr:hypothetical protein BN14_03723 [Rhizoctonia solani AG-1 IB]
MIPSVALFFVVNLLWCIGLVHTRPLLPRQDNPVPVQLLSSSQIALVEARMLEQSKGSWELGTATQSLFEYEYPSFSVYGDNFLAPPKSLPKSADISKILKITDQVLLTRPPGVLSFMPDQAAGDPPSLGVSMLFANWTVRSPASTGSSSYAAAIIDQLNYSLTRAPRAPNGAISHRVDQIQLWTRAFCAPHMIRFDSIAIYFLTGAPDFGATLCLGTARILIIGRPEMAGPLLVSCGF